MAAGSVFFRGRLSVNCGKKGPNCGRANILKCNHLNDVFRQFLPQHFFASGASVEKNPFKRTFLFLEKREKNSGKEDRLNQIPISVITINVQ